MMKKVTYLLTIMFAVVLMSTSCCEDDPVVPDLTLEEQYSEWSNLSWVSTNGNDVNYQPVEETYPRLYIRIEGNVATVTDSLDENIRRKYQFEEIILDDAFITFTDSKQVSGVERTFKILLYTGSGVKLEDVDFDFDVFILQ